MERGASRLPPWQSREASADRVGVAWVIGDGMSGVGDGASRRRGKTSTGVPLQDHLRHGERVGVRDGEQRPEHTHLFGAAGSAPVQPQLRGASLAEHFDVFPQDTARMTRAERLHGRFFRGKPSGQMRRGISPARTIGNLSVGEDATKKPFAVPLEHVGHARNVGGVEPQADDVHV